MTRWTDRSATAACLSLALLAPRASRADQPPLPGNVASANNLFREARKLVDEGNYRQACPKFEESLRLNVGIGTQFNLADCWEHVGRLASARSLFLGVAASAHAVGQAEREQVARARADALEPRLQRLLIQVQATDPQLVVRRNHVNVEPDVWGTATPIDPGTYLIEAMAPGKKPWTATVVVPVAVNDAPSVTVPALEPDSSEPTPVGDEPAPSSVSTPPSVSPPEPAAARPRRSARRTAYALSIAGFGVASAGLGAILGLEYLSKNDEAKGVCPTRMGCSVADVNRHSQLVSDAKAFRTWSFVGFGVGGAALIGAAVLYFAPERASRRASIFLPSPFVAADGSWGATVAGTF
jgi:hypothetical protein